MNTLRCIYLSAIPVVGFRVECPFYKLYKVFPFPSSGATASPEVERGESELDTGSATFEAQCETKDTCFGCKSTRIRLDRARFMATFSRIRRNSNTLDAIIEIVRGIYNISYEFR